MESNLLIKQLVFTAPPLPSFLPPSLNSSPSSSQTLPAVRKLAQRSQGRRGKGADGPCMLPGDRESSLLAWAAASCGAGEGVCSGWRTRTRPSKASVSACVSAPHLRAFSSVSQGSHGLPPRLPSGSDEIRVRRVASTVPGLGASSLAPPTPKVAGTGDLCCVTSGWLLAFSGLLWKGKLGLLCVNRVPQ